MYNSSFNFNIYNYHYYELNLTNNNYKVIFIENNVLCEKCYFKRNGEFYK